jgi:hypothetical protein
VSSFQREARAFLYILKPRPIIKLNFLKASLPPFLLTSYLKKGEKIKGKKA